MLRFILYLFLAWFLYKLVFGFIIPIYRTTRIMKKKFREMNEGREQQMRQQGFGEPRPEEKAASTPVGGDYIDFEEVK